MLVLDGKSQDLWPSEDGEWRLEVTYSLFLPAEYHIYVNGDTLIEGVNCTKMRTDHIYSIPSPDEPNEFETFFVREEYLHFNGDSLFWWKEDEFRLLLCFSCDVGDSWYPLKINELNQDCDSTGITLAQKDSVEYNNVWYRRIRIETPNWETSPFFWEGIFDERTFSRDYFYPEYTVCGSIVEWLMFSFMCYSDGDLSLPEPNGDCSSMLLSSEDLKVNTSVRVYPNPISQGEKLIVGEFDEIRIFDLSGRLVWQSQESNQRIYLNLNSGTYLITVIKDEESYTSRLVVK